ncbi:MAG: hypothetical protein ACLUE8_00965 [Lachnospiraceae bacterium]
MQMKELQSMTVVQLRALARENKVKLSAGIDKEGIVRRLYHALGDFGQKAPAADSCRRKQRPFLAAKVPFPPRVPQCRRKTGWRNLWRPM